MSNIAERLDALERIIRASLSLAQAAEAELAGLRDELVARPGPALGPGGAATPAPAPAAEAAPAQPAAPATPAAEPVTAAAAAASGGVPWVLVGAEPAPAAPVNASAATAGGRNRYWLVTGGDLRGLYASAAAARSSACASGQPPTSVEGVPTVAAACERWAALFPGVELSRHY